MSQEDVRRRIGYLIKQAQHAFNRSCEQGLRPLGLSMSQYAVLRAVADAGAASAADIARRTFVTRQSLRDVLSGLKKAGLVHVAAQPATGRALPVTLTGAGRSLLDQADRVVLGVDDRMLADLAPEDADRLSALLDTCIRNLS